jgi:monothiol glutaredoxin
MSESQAKIRELIDNNRVMLFMKGNKSFPACGFSSQVVQILKQHKADFQTFNVLSDPEIRQGAKDFSEWPTFPQLYIGGEFIGGCDIVTQLDANGELSAKLADE